MMKQLTKFALTLFASLTFVTCTLLAADGPGYDDRDIPFPAPIGGDISPASMHVGPGGTVVEEEDEPFPGCISFRDWFIHDTLVVRDPYSLPGAPETKPASMKRYWDSYLVQMYVDPDTGQFIPAPGSRPEADEITSMKTCALSRGQEQQPRTHISGEYEDPIEYVCGEQQPSTEEFYGDLFNQVHWGDAYHGHAGPYTDEYPDPSVTRTVSYGRSQGTLPAEQDYWFGENSGGTTPNNVAFNPNETRRFKKKEWSAKTKKVSYEIYYIDDVPSMSKRLDNDQARGFQACNLEKEMERARRHKEKAHEREQERKIKEFLEEKYKEEQRQKEYESQFDECNSSYFYDEGHSKGKDRSSFFSGWWSC